MATYGPWIQGPDFNASVSVATITRYTDPTYTHAEWEVRPDPAIDQAQVDAVIVASEDAWVSGRPTVLNTQLEVAVDHWPGSIFFPEPYTRYAAYRHVWPLPVTAWAVNEAPWIPEDERPPGAITYDYEGRLPGTVARCEVLAADLAWTVVSGDGERNVGPDAGSSTATWSVTDSGVWSTAADGTPSLVAWGADTDAVGTALASLPDSPAGTEVELSASAPVFNTADGRMVLFATIDVSEPPPWPQINGASRGVFGYRFKSDSVVTATYTLRPPRHRFIFPDGLSVPYLRVYPRDDQLGAVSAGRVWPPSRSEQGSSAGRIGPNAYI